MVLDQQDNSSDPGGQNDPQPLAYFVSNNPDAVISQISLDNGGERRQRPVDFAGEADNLRCSASGAGVHPLRLRRLAGGPLGT